MIEALKKITKILYHTSPAKLHSLANQVIADIRINRAGKERPWILDQYYMARRDPFIQNILQRILKGEFLDDVLKQYDASNFDERVIEYAYLTQWLIKLPDGLNLIDIGCVLNNKLVSNLLKVKCNTINFVNPIIESKIHIQNPVLFHVLDLDNFIPTNDCPPLITSLSTLEHIGYDNSQYGYRQPAKYDSPSDVPLLESIRKLLTLLPHNGKMLLSFPYGFRETIIHPLTGKTAMQVFDYQSIVSSMELFDQSGLNAQYSVYALENGKWQQVKARNCNKRYADGYPAAGAVAFIESGRMGQLS